MRSQALYRAAQIISTTTIIVVISLGFHMFPVLDDAFCKSVVIPIVDCVVWACV